MDGLATIREMRADDLEDCTRLLRETYDRVWESNWTYENSRRYLEGCFRNYNFLSYVVEIDGMIKGAIFCHIRPGWAEDKLFIDELLIAKDMVDRGYELKLLSLVEDFALENRLEGIILGLRDNSIWTEFFEDNGYRIPENIQVFHKNI